MNPVPLFFPLVAPAAEATEHVAKHLTPFEFILESNVINFLIALALITFMIKKFNVGGMLQQNRDKLKAEIDSLENERKKAENQLTELKRQTANLGTEISSILGQARESAEGISKQILDTAKNDAARLVETSKRRIEAEQKAAAKELEKRLLVDALQDARLELAQNLNGNDQKRSVEDFIKELGSVKH